MRYQDWDILLFPQGLGAPPIKEFRVACYVVHDTEFSQTQGSFGLPTLCCFVPSLPAGTPFQISIHSWNIPVFSQFTKLYSMHPEDAKFEFRVFVDGQLVASASLDRDTNGPHVIAHCFNFAKNGDLGPLKFPVFQKEILQQSYWSPADDLGRIKVVISEGFPRDSLSMPIERVRNIVAFSFQHAPLEFLESSSIAWPNDSMWRRAPFASSMPVPAYPSDDVASHAHSPRHRTLGPPTAAQSHSISGFDDSIVNGSGRCMPQGLGWSSSPSKLAHGPLGFGSTESLENNNPYFEWLTNMDMNMSDVPPQSMATFPKTRRSRKASTDISMPDFSSTRSGQDSVLGDAPFTLSSFEVEDDRKPGNSRAPSNTPTTTGQGIYEKRASARSVVEREMSFPTSSHSSGISSDFADSLTSYLLNQTGSFPCRTPSIRGPTIEPRSRKEARLSRPTPSTGPSIVTREENRQERQSTCRQLSVQSESYHPASVGRSRTITPKTLNSSDLNQRTPSIMRYSGKMTTKEDQENVLDEVQASCDNGTKRVRHFTPTIAKNSNEIDGPKWDSPLARLASSPEAGPIDTEN